MPELIVCIKFDNVKLTLTKSFAKVNKNAIFVTQT